VFEYAAGVGDADLTLRAGFGHLERDQGYLLGQLFSGAFEDGLGELVSGFGTPDHDGREGSEVGAGTLVSLFDDLA